MTCSPLDGTDSVVYSRELQGPFPPPHKTERVKKGKLYRVFPLSILIR